MSRTKQRHRAKIERAGSGGSITIPASMLLQIMNNNAPQKNKADMFAPGAPLEPTQGVTPQQGPRQWAYAPGINLSGVDRTLGNQDIPSFQQLRTLAMNLSYINLAERVWCDLIPRMTIKVTLHKHLKEQGMEDKNFQKEITKYRTFFEKPDGTDDIHVWLRKSVVDQTQIDGLALFKRRTRGGGLLGLDIVDASTIKPILDERGRVPMPPYPAYQQFPYGVPGELYNTDQMIYYRESPRSFTPYGFSRVERIMLNVNQALRKQQKDLARWTEGNMPSGIMEVPDTTNWSPDQIDTYEQVWNALIAGNAQQQVRVKFTQPGFHYNKIDEEVPSTEFDKFLFNLTLASYGLSMVDVGFTGDIHKSADAGQQNMTFRRTIDPIAIAYSHIFTNVIRDDFHDNRFLVEFGGYDEEEDLQAEVTTFNMAVQGALISPKDAAAKLGFPDLIDTGPLFMTATGPVPLANFEIGSEFRKAADQATLANSQMSVETLNSQQIADQQAASGGGQNAQQSGSDQGQQDNQDSQRAISNDFKRWREVALKDIKMGKPIRAFSSTVIPPQEYNRLNAALQQCTTADEIREVFNGNSPFFTREVAISGGNQPSSKLLWRNTPLV